MLPLWLIVPELKQHGNVLCWKGMRGKIITKALLITTTADFTYTCRWEYAVDVLNTTSSGIANFHFGHTYTHFKRWRIWGFMNFFFFLVHLILLFHLCFPPESSLADCSERSSRWKAKSCRGIWSHASCSWSVTVYSHSQLTVLPPQTYVRAHTITQTNFLWWQRKPAAMKTATLNQFCRSLQSRNIYSKQTALSSSGGTQSKRFPESGFKEKNNRTKQFPG